MSCMMLTAKQTAILAATLANMYNIGLAQGGSAYENFGLDMDGREWTSLLRDNGCLERGNYCNARELARVLYSVNMAAYNGRYGDYKADDILETVWDGFFDPHCYNRGLARYASWGDNHRHELAQWHFDFSVLLDHYLYQIDEDATRDGDVFKVLTHQAAMVKSNIVSMDPRRRDTFSLLRELM